MDEQEKLSAKKLLVTEYNINKGIADNSNVAPVTSDSLANIPSSKPRVSTFERFKSFRAKCGIVDESSSSATPNSLTIKQVLSKYESLEKEEYSFATFWKKHQASLPILSNMARRCGCVTASSVPSESAFSIAGHIARKTRSSLTAKNLKYSVFLKDKI